MDSISQSSQISSDSQLMSSNLSSSKVEDSTLIQSNLTSNGQASTFLSTGSAIDTDSTTNISVSLTDLTSGLSSSNLTDTDAEKSKNVTRDLIFKKQILHDIQKLKIELSQKNLLIDTLKADHLNQMDDLEDKLADAIHKKQLIQAQYETQIRLYKNDSEKKIATLKKELQESMRAQKAFQGKYQDLASKQTNFNMMDFVQTELSEDEYLELKGKSEEHISAQEFFNVRYIVVIVLLSHNALLK